MMIGVLGSLAEYERELGKERTALKRQASRANSSKFGRPKKVKDGDNIATARRMKAAGHAARDIPKYFGVSRATLYRYLKSTSLLRPIITDDRPVGARVAAGAES
jgi:DNA invertase Pin-like site-specific DNA recombinase